MMSGCGGGETSARPINFDVGEDADEIAAAARSNPTQGGVTQSSNVETGRVTADRIEVTWTSDRSGNRYRVTNTPSNDRGGWAIDADDDSVIVLENDRNNRALEFGPGLRKRLDDGELLLHVFRLPQSFEQSELEDANVDYLSAGLWKYVPESDPDNPILGAFADGRNGFDSGNLQGLAGRAFYRRENGALGLFVAEGIEDPNLPSNGSFFATVQITADFDDNTISGWIDQFRGEDGNTTPDTGMRLILVTTNIDTAREHGFSRGPTRLFMDKSNSDGSSGGNGNWAVQFHGNGASTTDHPLAVAGTFGNSRVDDDGAILSIVGAYMAPLE